MIITVTAYAHGSAVYEIFATEFSGFGRAMYKAAMFEARFQKRQSGKVTVRFFKHYPNTQFTKGDFMGEITLGSFDAINVVVTSKNVSEYDK